MATDTAPAPTKMSGRKVAALWLMIAPTAMIIGVFFIFAIANWGLGYAPGVEGIRTALNIVLWLIGVLGFISWLPALIVGIVLLTATPKPSTPEGK